MPALSGIPAFVNIGTARGETELSKVWLQALGVHALVASGPESTDEYKDILEPQRFENVLPVLHREQGDTIYAVPHRNGSMAHVIKAGEVTKATTSGIPANQDVIRYVNALEDASRSPARCDWLSAGAARIRARLEPGDAVSVQVAHFGGWKAYIAGQRQAVEMDGLGFILIRPQCEGECEIVLKWTGRWDFYLAAAVSIAALGVVVRLLSV
jgi:hypothetical protein